jgi:uncharacterized damage-inducible protein DinB
MKELARQQYEWVKGSRQVLFDYCRLIPVEDFVEQNTSFGRGGSMRNLLVHVANTYQFWIANTALGLNVPYPAYDDISDIEGAIALFGQVDAFMATFIARLDIGQEIPFTLSGQQGAASLSKLFTHVITHEYHHKGQILSLSRHLGYVPIDTDVMR